MNRHKLLKSTIFLISSLFFLGSTFTNNALAAKKKKTKRRFPLGCRPIGYEFKDNLLILKPVSNKERIQTLYLIHNVSHQPVYMEIKKLDTQAFSPSYENTINPNSWGAFALNQEVLQLSCSTHGSPLDCWDILELCQYNNAKFAEHNQGTYWIVKSGSRSHAVYGAIHNGILLKS